MCAACPPLPLPPRPPRPPSAPYQRPPPAPAPPPRPQTVVLAPPLPSPPHPSLPRRGGFLSSLFARFYSKNLNLVLIGLENGGKTTLLSVLSTGAPVTTVPTIGLTLKTVRKGNVAVHCWDIGGQAAYREEWLRYTAEADVVA